MSKHIFITFTLLIAALSAIGQGSVRGFIKDKESGQPVYPITVGLLGTGYGSQTDNTGYFSITKVPSGKYTLVIYSIEFEEVKEEIEIGDGKVLSKNYLLNKASVEMGVLDISSQKSDRLNNVNISSETIRSQDIKKIPSIGGQADLVQYLTVLPGFVSTGDQGGQIFVRGGSPVQNKVLLDGMIVYNPFHSIGLFSVFDTDVIGSAEVFTGGFNAQYGGRISSVMDITTRDGNKRKMSGRAGINPFGAKVLLEGPLKKLNERGGGISYILSFKNSYLDRSSTAIYPYVNGGNGLPFRYRDLYGKISLGGSTGSKLNLFGFSFNDAVTKYQALSNLSWTNNGMGGNFVVAPSGSTMLINGNFAYSNYNCLLKEETNPDRSTGISSFNFGLDFKYAQQDNVLNYGVDVVGFATEYNTFNPLGLKVQEENNMTELNGFVTYKIKKKKWIVEPGLRLQYYSSISIFSPEPRIGIKYKQSERLRWKLAAGKYSQNLIATNSDRDVVNLFYGFLAAPEETQNQFTMPDYSVREVQNSLQKALHYVVGAEWDITDAWNLNVESYYRDFRQITNINRNKIFPDDGDNQDKPEILRKDFIIETGRAYGADFVLKYENKRQYVYMVYSLMKVDRWDGFRWYAPVFDRRHNINLVATQKMGKDRDWELSARWNLGSGLPFTQTQGYYQPNVLNGVGISADYISSNSNEMGIQFAGLNNGRLPYYHRLDVNLKRVWKGPKFDWEWNVGATNMYNRQNVFYIDRITAKRTDQLPFMYNMGIELHF
jgi:hypothetical protein